jgi:predicted acyl esterase
MFKLRTAAAAAVVFTTLAGGIGAIAPSAGAAVTAHGSIDQAYVLGAKKSQKVTLLNKKGKKVATGKADSFGSFIFQDIKAGKGYRVATTSSGKTKKTKAFKVLAPGENPKQSFYDSQPPMVAGLNYVKMRDGTELAMTVRLPKGKTLADGPFPTFIEYSGYQTAAPHDLLDSVIKSLGGGGGASDPLAPATSTAVGAVIGPLMGYAVVSVQMRGSGCSGGAFDLFGYNTTYDGYDAVETVAAQPWVLGHKVGMGGISFSGITQLYVGGTNPPHLAGLTPMSVTDDVYTATGYPGGIFNSGFAKSWINERAEDAMPAPAGGQPWAKALTQAGDQHCIDNQKLRLQTLPVNKLIKENPYRTPALFDQRSGADWMKHIKVPILLIGQFQDEQTGGHFPESIKNLAKNKNVWVALQNGVHADSLGPSTITRWAEFMSLFVAHRKPVIPGTILSLSGELYKYLADAAAIPVAQSRFANSNTTVDQDIATFKKDPRITLYMDNGGSNQGPGSIGATWKIGLGSWPVKQATATSLYLGNGGSLGAKPASAGTATYTSDPKARPKQTLPGDGDADAWKAQPPYVWAPIAANKGLGFTTGAFAKDTLIAGSSSLDLYLKSSAKDTDLQVTLSEVRPDGHETYVQNGWLRASHRKLNTKESTAIDPVPTHLKKDGAPLPKGKYSLVRVPIFPVAHMFRAGSKLRVTVEAPGGDRPRWDFDTLPGTQNNTVALGGARASKLVVPIVPGVTAQGTPLPGPTALRGEPDRMYKAASNGG